MLSNLNPVLGHCVSRAIVLPWSETEQNVKSKLCLRQTQLLEAANRPIKPGHQQHCALQLRHSVLPADLPGLTVRTY